MKTLRYSCRLTSVKGGKILMPPLQSLEEQADLKRCCKQPPEAPTMNDHPHRHPKVIQLHQPFSRNTEVPCSFRRVSFLDHSSSQPPDVKATGLPSCSPYPTRLECLKQLTFSFSVESAAETFKNTFKIHTTPTTPSRPRQLCEWRILHEQTSRLVHSLLS